MAIGIYCYTNMINGKSYIGQSNDLEYRHRYHKWAYNHKNNRENKLLYKAMRKYGYENFDYKVLEICNADELDQKEIYYIEKYNSFINGYNLTYGGHANSCSNSKEVFKIDPKTKDVVEKYHSLSEAAKMNNVPATNIWKVCQGKQSHCKGYYYCYVEDYATHKYKDIQYGYQFILKPVVQYSLNHDKIAEYESIESAARSIKRRSNSIKNNLIGLSKTAYGFIWEYKERVEND